MLFTRAAAALLSASSAIAVSVDYAGLKNARGDGLPDFSYSGYRASNEALPAANRAATKTISASSGSADQKSQIQEALDAVAGGGGGVVALGAGSFRISGTLTIPNGTALRGAGPSKTTLLPASGKFDAVVLGADLGKNPGHIGPAVAITDRYVPVGAVEVTVKDAAGLKPGQLVRVQRAVTDKWVRANGMADLVRDGKPQTWLTTKDTVYQPRTIASVSSNKVTLDIPLTDQLDAAYMSPELAQFSPPEGATREMGLEALSIVLSPTCSGRVLGDDACGGRAVVVRRWSTDSYARSLSITGFNNAVNVEPDASRITVQKVSAHRDHVTDNGAGYAADIAISGYQVLVVDSGTKAITSGDRQARSFPVVTQGLTPGPNAVVRHFGQLAVSAIQPHAHWAHGLLVDNSTATTTLINRATAGSGHGWAISAGVAWNIIGDYNVQSPPLGTNWCVGCRAGSRGKGNNGTMIEEAHEVEPISLFEAQLAARRS